MKRLIRTIGLLALGVALLRLAGDAQGQAPKPPDPKTAPKTVIDPKTAPKVDPKAAPPLDGKAKAAEEAKALEETKAKAAAEVKALEDAKAKAAAEVKALEDAKAKAAAEVKALEDAKAKAAPPAPEPAKVEVKGPEVKADEKADPAKTPAMISDVENAKGEAKQNGDMAWMMVSSGLVMFMVPGLALFYCGMVRKKNILATMMQSMVALAVVGVYWVAIGYCLAFGETQGGFIGWSPDKLLFMKGVKPDELLANTNIPVYLHMVFQGMFAIITPALISGAIAERIKFGPYCLFIILWVTLVYCPLAHMVWAMNWWDVTMVEGKLVAAADAGKNMVGFLGKAAEGQEVGALDFAGGTVVHIAAGFTALAAILVLRKRYGYPERAFHPNSIVLTVLGAGMLWFGWFGFNGGSALGSNSLAVSAFAATQAAAAGAALTWMVAEWLVKGKPTALGWASGAVAGLVAVTPASGFVQMWGGLAIGLIAGVVCYICVALKPKIKYDDSLDVVGVHGIGGFLGAVLTGVFCYKLVNSAGADGLIAGNSAQVLIQLKAAVISAVIAFVGGGILVFLIDKTIGFVTTEDNETDGLDQTEHGEVGFDFGAAMESMMLGSAPEPRSASAPGKSLAHRE